MSRDVLDLPQLVEDENITIARLKFRIGSCVNVLRIANWYGELGSKGVSCPPVMLDGAFLPAYRMCEEERAEFTQRSKSQRREAHRLILETLGSDAVETIEALASFQGSSQHLVEDLAAKLLHGTEQAADPVCTRERSGFLHLRPSRIKQQLAFPRADVDKGRRWPAIATVGSVYAYFGMSAVRAYWLASAMMARVSASSSFRCASW